MSLLNLTIKFSNAEKFEVQGDRNDTILEFKEKIAPKVNVNATQQRLIYRGRVLKDEHTLDTYDIQDGHVRVYFS